MMQTSSSGTDFNISNCLAPQYLEDTLHALVLLNRVSCHYIITPGHYITTLGTHTSKLIMILNSLTIN